MEIIDELRDAWAMDSEDAEGLKIIEQSPWEDEGKYSTRYTVVLFKGSHFSIDERRSGSYFTDYHYDDPEFYEVKPVEKTKTYIVWEVV